MERFSNLVPPQDDEVIKASLAETLAARMRNSSYYVNEVDGNSVYKGHLVAIGMEKVIVSVPIKLLPNRRFDDPNRVIKEKFSYQIRNATIGWSREEAAAVLIRYVSPSEIAAHIHL